MCHITRANFKILKSVNFCNRSWNLLSSYVHVTFCFTNCLKAYDCNRNSSNEKVFNLISLEKNLVRRNPGQCRDIKRFVLEFAKLDG